MFTFFGIALVCLLVGVGLGRHPQIVLWLLKRCAGLPMQCLKWIGRKIVESPQVFAAFSVGLLLGLLVSGVLTKILWTLTFCGVLLFAILVLFPKKGTKMLHEIALFGNRCLERVKNFFA
ncbi:MAG: hypothetical protein ACRC10_02200 [Thermoguttaceae bacterium]